MVRVLTGRRFTIAARFIGWVSRKPPGAKRVVDQPTAGPALSEIAPDDRRPDPIHCDVLHHARRLWKDRLPDCRLQTLERFICGRRRRGDIPGRDIPDVYHDYVRTGKSAAVQSVLHHNALDLITLLQLTMQIVMSDGRFEPASSSGIDLSFSRRPRQIVRPRR